MPLPSDLTDANNPPVVGRVGRSTTPTLDAGRLRAALSSVFQTHDPLFVVGTPTLRDSLAGTGLRTLGLEDFNADPRQAPPGTAVVLVSTDLAKSVSDEAWAALERCRLLSVPISSFGADDDTALYSLQMLAAVDFDDAVAQAFDWMTMLEQAVGTLTIATPDASCALELDDDIGVLQPKLDVETALGEWTTPADYLEMALVAARGSTTPCHRLNGEYVATGAAVACHRYHWRKVRPMADEAWARLQSYRSSGEFPLRLQLVDSRVTRIRTAGGRDVLHDLLPLVDRDVDTATTELAFATNSLPPDDIDWRWNTPMNEAACGMHLALGSGLNGAHIDFIEPTATVTWYDEDGAEHVMPRHDEPA
ncbi:MAG: hypothetical protein ACJ74O_07320 [Frankiaceae bacterium]